VPRTVTLAAELASLGARFVVVGSTARLLRGERPARPADLDVVVEEADVDPLVAALHAIGVATSAPPILRCRHVRLLTGWGPLDVVVAPWPPHGTTYAGADLRVVAA
jgi:hypothetical protein